MPTWDELFKQDEHRLRQPHHAVVAFAGALRMEESVESV